jgi:hypothetical protein
MILKILCKALLFFSIFLIFDSSLQLAEQLPALHALCGIWPFGVRLGRKDLEMGNCYKSEPAAKKPQSLGRPVHYPDARLPRCP